MAKVVEFRFRRPEASSVALAGDFNDWSPTAHPMVYDPERDLWLIRLELPTGRYEYKFLVDGSEWWNDREAPKMPNVWGSENSYVEVP